MSLEIEKKVKRPDEVDLVSIFKVINQYKISIMLIALIAFMTTYIYLYFKPSIYSAYALVEVKGQEDTVNTLTQDFIAKQIGSGTVEKVDKEMEILKTFYLNNKALKFVDLRVKYFIDSEYKNVEIYNKIPITIKDIKVKDGSTGYLKLQLTQAKNGFYLTKNQSFISSLVSFNEVSSALMAYDKPLQIEGYEFVVHKNEYSSSPVYFQIYSSNQAIFESTVLPNLHISQANVATPLIKIEYTDNVPQRAFKYADALAESFISDSVKDKSGKNSKVIDFIDTQLISVKDKLKSTEEQLEEYQAKNNLVQPSIQADTLIKELSSLDIKNSENQYRDRLIDSLSDFVSQDRQIDSIAPSLMELNDQPTLSLINQLQQEQLKLDALSVEYTPQHPDVLKAKELVAAIRKKILQNVKTLKYSSVQKTKNLNELKLKYESMLQGLPNQEKNLINLKRDYEVNSNMYEYLLKKKSENEIIQVSVVSDYKKIGQTYLQSEPIAPKRGFILLISLLLGLVVGILLAVLRYFINDKIQGKTDIENVSRLPIYGIIPTEKGEVGIEVFKSAKSPFSESFRSLRTNLQFALKSDDANVILITSSISGEGKTTVSANLASIFQITNFKTVVIDLDMRKPSLHKLFGVANAKGMSTYLSYRSELHEIINKTKYPFLDLITAGPIPPNPSELVFVKRLELLIKELKNRYEFIIIDTSPIGMVNDSFTLMKYSDINLMVFRENFTKKDFVSSLDRAIKEQHVGKIGIILNGSKVKGSSGYGYGYGYGAEGNG